MIMARRTIRISGTVYEMLERLRNDEKASFSAVIVKHYPKRRKLSEVLMKIEANPELADSIERISKEMREAKLRRDSPSL